MKYKLPLLTTLCLTTTACGSKDSDDSNDSVESTESTESTDSETGDSETGDSETGDSETDDSETDDSETDDSETDDSETDDSETDDSETDDPGTIAGDWSLSNQPAELCVDAYYYSYYSYTYDGQTYTESYYEVYSYCFNISQFDMAVSETEGVASVDSTSVEGTLTMYAEIEETYNGAVVYSDTVSESLDLEDDLYAEFAAEAISLESSGEDQYRMVIADGGMLELNCTLTSDTSMTCDLEGSSLIDHLEASDPDVTREYSGSLDFEK